MKILLVPLYLFVFISFAHAQSESVSDATPPAEFVPTSECLSLQKKYERIGQVNPDSKHFYDHIYPSLSNVETMQRSNCEIDRIYGESEAATENQNRALAASARQDEVKLAKHESDMAQIARDQRESANAWDKSYNARIAKEAAERSAKLAKLTKCCHIGMTTAEVLVSRKGSPESKNRTMTASHTHEQWVYKYGEYLYFDDGVLTAIQD
jgi:hypothetical protein